jgi:hypothetical protein
MAVALELATPIYEFDTKIEVDPIKRYQHYADAYKNGELDPAFPHFSVWEMRHIINSNAKDEQLAWGRKMLMVSKVAYRQWKLHCLVHSRLSNSSSS